MSPTIRPKQVINTVNSFLRVIIEQIWYHISIYPKESFEEYVFYDIQVYSCRHPEVISYLDSLCDSVLKLMKDGGLSNVYLEAYQNNQRQISVAFSFKNSLLFDQIQNDPQFYSVERELFDGFDLIVQWKSLLFSIISALSVGNIDLGNDIGNFKIMVSTCETYNLSSDTEWIFEKSLNQTSLESDMKFQDADVQPFKNITLGYINVKSYIAYY